MTRKEFVADIIAENCIECAHFKEDIRTSPCLCDVIADVILQKSGCSKSQKYVSEWEQQREELIAKEM